MIRKYKKFTDTLVMFDGEFESICFDGYDCDEMIVAFEPCPVRMGDDVIGIVLSVDYGDTDEETDIKIHVFDEYVLQYLKCKEFKFSMGKKEYGCLIVA